MLLPVTSGEEQWNRIKSNQATRLLTIRQPDCNNLSDKLEEAKNTHECQEHGRTHSREYPLGDGCYRRKVDRRLDPVFSFSLQLPNASRKTWSIVENLRLIATKVKE